MILETLTNQWVILGMMGVLGVIGYFIFTKKDKNLEGLENEYRELLTAEQYKVKGQY